MAPGRCNWLCGPTGPATAPTRLSASTAHLVHAAPYVRRSRRAVAVRLSDAVQFWARNPELRDVRDFANPDPRPKPDSPALADESYIGAFARSENWLEGWTVFGPESIYDLTLREQDGN